MITVMDLGNNEKMEEKCLEPQLWHACAGGMVQMPKVNTKVFYFPQGHWEHANIKKKPEFGGGRNLFPPLILCRVSSIKYLADSETDEVYAKLRLISLKTASDYNDCEDDDDDDDDNNGGLLLGFNDDNINNSNNDCVKPNSFAKTLTQSDANNGGGFSVPRYCADTIFPKLNFKAEPPVQTILAKDVHGEVWKFRHIFRGTPRRHLLTTGWSNFVNQKKLVAGDSIVFLRADNGGDLFVGIRRAKRVGIGIGIGIEIGIGGGGGGLESPSGWNAGGAINNYGSSRYGGLSSLLTVGDGDEVSREGLGRRGGGGKVKAESVTEALNLASNGQPFEVIYYPRANTPEFVVKASSVNSAMRINWCPGMRFKMPFETEDSSRISWFMGTISSVQVDDPIHWPKSPWRLLQVAWDEPDLLQNVKSVSPWLVEVVSNLPTINLTPFSPPSRKKLRIPQSPEFSFTGHHHHQQQQLTMSSFLSNNNPLSPSSPLCCLSDNNNNNYSNISAGGIQGARHPPQLGFPLTLPLPSSDYTNKLQQQQQQRQNQGQFPFKLKQFSDNHPASPPPPKIQFGNFTGNSSQFRENENVSCVLTMGNSSQELKTTAQTKRRPTFVLFGQPILTEQQISQSSSSSLDENQYKTTTTTTTTAGGSGSGGPPPPLPEYYYCCSDGVLPWYHKDQKNDLVSENSSSDSDHCKVFMDSEDVGRTMDLSVVSCYEELYGKLAEMFNLKRSEMLSNVLYQDMAGTTVKRAGEEPFSKFLKSARRINILTDSGSDNIGI